MSKAIETDNGISDVNQIEMDSKYRMIIVAAQRSKQLQRGSRPRVEMEAQRHKFTRIALEEVQSGKVPFEIVKDE